MEQNQGRMSEGRGLPAGTLTFLFTDIEGSTKLQSELGTDRYQDVLETHTRILREAFKDGGFEVRVEGDALELGAGEIGEDREAAQRVADVVGAERIAVVYRVAWVLANARWRRIKEA